MKKFLIAMAALLLGGIFASPASAQYIGNVGLQTAASTPFNNVLCTGGAQTATIPNNGQAGHWVNAIAGAPAPSTFLMVIQGSNDGSIFTDISDQSTTLNANSPTATLTGNGYYAVVRVSVTCLPVTARFTVQYSGVSVSPGTPVGAQAYAQVMKNVATAQAANANLANVTIRSPFGNSSGGMQFTYTGAGGPAGSTLSVICSSTSSFPSNRTMASVTLIATSNITQYIEVPPAACPFLTLNYISGGASAALFNWDYSFYGLGISPNATPNVYKTATATAAGNTVVWTPTVSKRFVLQGVCVDVSGNATLAAAAVETIDLQDATTSTGITFSVFINNAGGTTGSLFSQCIPSMGNGFTSAVPQNQLNVNLSTALATGIVRVRAYGFEE